MAEFIRRELGSVGLGPVRKEDDAGRDAAQEPGTTEVAASQMERLDVKG